MYMKGADSIVMKRLSKDNKLNLNQQLERFSLIGLRTLLIAMKTLSDEEYKTFKNERTNLKGMAPQEKQKVENDLIDKLEQNMFVIGATAVLDRLQDEVPETIRDLLRASKLILLHRYKGMDVDWRQNGDCRKYCKKLQFNTE